MQVFTRQFHALVALGVTDRPLEVCIAYTVACSVFVYVCHTMHDVLNGRMLTL